jgi:tripeptide aminopeptidase
MKLGRIDPETTANIGRIEGGIADNIVPPKVVAFGEARSLKPSKLKAQTRHMGECFEEAARALKGRVKVEAESAYPALSVPKTARIARLASQAARNLGRTLAFRRAGGASDASILFNRGIEITDIGTGMRDIHTVREWLDLPEFFLSAEIVLEVLRLHNGGDRELKKAPES